MKIKLLITSRPESDIQSFLSKVEKQLQVDSGKVNADLSKFVHVKVEELSRNKRYPKKLADEVRSALIEHSGGTFLWAALVLDDLRKTKRPDLVPKKLRNLPSGIYEVYDRILRQIEEEDEDVAKIILRWVVGARRPLTVEEFATVLAFAADDHDQGTLPSDEDVEIRNETFRCCEPLIYLDTSKNTINLVHQSAKDYLLGDHLSKNTSLSQYRILADETQLFIFETCWSYLTVAEFGHGSMIVERRRDELDDVDIPSDDFDRHKFLRYAVNEWIEHALAASRMFSNGFKWDRLKLAEASTLRDLWLIWAASSGQETVVRELLGKGGSNLNSRDISGRTSLSYAAERGHVEVVRLLLATTGIEPNSRDEEGRTPLSYAAEMRYIEVVRVLLATAGVEPNLRDEEGRTPLSYAAEIGYIEVVQALLATASVEPNLRNNRDQTPLSYAAKEGHIEVIQVLLATASVEPNLSDNWGYTPLWYATKERHVEVVQILKDFTK